VGQVFNLRRIVNPPAALGRARHDRGESPAPVAACRYAGQDGVRRGGWLPPPFEGGPITNRPQINNLPHIVLQLGFAQASMEERSCASTFESWFWPFSRRVC